jgi:hypothetical protein
MLNLGRSLQRCAFLLCACLAVQAASAQTSAGSPVTNTLLAVGASKPVDLPTPVNSFLPDPLLPERWSSPVNINADLIRTQARLFQYPNHRIRAFRAGASSCTRGWRFVVPGHVGSKGVGFCDRPWPWALFAAEF